METVGNSAAYTRHIPMAERPRLVQALHSEHRYMASLLDALAEQSVLLDQDKGADINLVLDIVNYMKSFPDRFHHPREDIVYEVLAEREKSIRVLLLELRREHNELERLAGEVVDAIDDVRLLPTPQKKLRASELCGDYIEMLRRHMDQEEAGVLPIASVVLDQQDWDDIEQRAARYEEMPAESVVDDQLQALRQRVAGRIDSMREDILLLEFLGMTTAMETAGALARGVAGIRGALVKGAAASWDSYLQSWRTMLPGTAVERGVREQWEDTWHTLVEGVEQLATASRILRQQAVIPGQSNWRLYGKVMRGLASQREGGGSEEGRKGS